MGWITAAKRAGGHYETQRDAKQRERDHAQRIAYIVFPWDAQYGLAQSCFVGVDAKSRLKLAKLDLFRAVIGVLGQTVAKYAVVGPTDPAGVWFVCAKENLTAGLAEELIENGLDCGQVSVKSRCSSSIFSTSVSSGL